MPSDFHEELNRHDLDTPLARDLLIGDTPTGVTWFAARARHTWRNARQFHRDLEALWAAELRRVIREGSPRASRSDPPPGRPGARRPPGPASPR
jgi:hypothetical protein